MKSLKKLLIGLFALSALSVIFVSCPHTPEENISVEKVTFSLAEGKVDSGSALSLSCATDGAVIYYLINSETELNSSNFTSVGTEYQTPITLTQDTSIKAIAVFTSSATGKTYTSEVSSANYTIAPVPVLTISPSATAVSEGIYAANTVFTITKTSAEENDSVTIYYSTSTTLTSANAETEGTVYGATSETDTTNLTLKEILNISAIAKGNNGWSRAASLTAKIPITYQKGAYEFDGGIKAAIEAINGSGSDVSLNSLTLSGIVTRIGNGALYIQDKDSGIQLYNSSLTTSNYAVGDYVTVSNVTSGMVYGNTGNAEITKFTTTLVKDESKARRIIYFKEIPSYVKDFTEYVDKGNAILYGFRGTASEHTTAPDYIYGVSTDNQSSEKIHIGIAVNSIASGIELSVWTSLDASDDILKTQTAPETYVVAPRFSQNGGNISSGATVNLTPVYPTNSDIYFKFIRTSDTTSTFTATNYSSEGTKYNTSDTSSGVPKITEDGTLYALAVSNNNVSRIASAKFSVISSNSEEIVYNGSNFSAISSQGSVAKSGGASVTDKSNELASITTTEKITVITFDKGKNSTVPKWWTDSFRVYKKNTIVFTPAENVKISSIVLTGQNTNNFTASSGTVSGNSTSTTWTGTATKEEPVTFTYNDSTNTVKWTSILINYTE